MEQVRNTTRFGILSLLITEILIKMSNAYKRYEDDDDIDVTEGYGKEAYYHWHYTNQGKDAGYRGNKAEALSDAREYLEESPEFAEGGWENQTDADLAFIRDQQLGIGDNQTERF